MKGKDKMTNKETCKIIYEIIALNTLTKEQDEALHQAYLILNDLVFCKDCTHCHKYSNDKYEFWTCESVNGLYQDVSPSGYCYHGDEK